MSNKFLLFYSGNFDYKKAAYFSSAPCFVRSSQLHLSNCTPLSRLLPLFNKTLPPYKDGSDFHASVSVHMLSVWLNWTSSMLTISIPFFQLVEPLMFLVRQVWWWWTLGLVWEDVTCPSLEHDWAGFPILGRCCGFVIQSFEFITPSSYCLLGFWETWAAWCPTPLNGILLGCVVCLNRLTLCHGLALD